MFRSAIVYMSEVPAEGNASVKVHSDPDLYVRVELSELNCGDALDAAVEGGDEYMLNTFPLVEYDVDG